MEITSNPVPTKRNPLGAKGAGEAGTVGALPAIVNAVIDALAAARGQEPRHAGDQPAHLAGDAGGAGLTATLLPRLMIGTPQLSNPSTSRVATAAPVAEGDSGDLGIRHADRSAELPTRHYDFGIVRCGSCVERDYAVSQQHIEQPFRCFDKPGFSASSGKLAIPRRISALVTLVVDKSARS